LLRAISDMAKASPFRYTLIACSSGSLLLWSYAVPADPRHIKLHELQEERLEMHWPHYLHPGGYPKHETMFTQWDMGYRSGTTCVIPALNVRLKRSSLPLNR
jgi:hypothetical protein